MSSQTIDVPNPCSASPQPAVWEQWLARRRITISLVGFTSLVTFHVLFHHAVPHNPLAMGDPVAMSALALLVMGLGLRSWAAGTLNKSREVTTTGPYALIRNPLYLGSFMMMIAFCILCRDWLTLAFIAGPMALLYLIQVRLEEHRLNTLFPEQWPVYVQNTPRFVPHSIPPTCCRGWSRREWLRNREYQAILASTLGVLAILILYFIRLA